MTQSIPPVHGRPTHAYTPWLRRVGATLIDLVPIGLLFAVCTTILVATRTCIEYPIPGLGTDQKPFMQQACGATAVGQWVFALFPLLALAILLWNYGYRQGTTGSSLGKSVVKYKIVSEATGKPIGFGRSTLRQLLHVLVDGLLCNVGYLFPLVDRKRQTLADKVMKTVALPR
jgi:uncharacterized RDD family membrane protein YckC